MTGIARYSLVPTERITKSFAIAAEAREHAEVKAEDWPNVEAFAPT
jgi:hypothetical protein